MASLKLMVALVFAMLLVVFGVQNTQSMTFHFLVFDLGPAPVVLAVFAAALIGAIVAWLVTVPGSMRGARTRRDLEHELSAANQRTAAAVTDLEDTRARSRPPEPKLPAEKP